MDTGIRRMALRNAAKVALGSLVMGCGGMIDTTDDGAAPDAAHDAPKDAVAKTDAATTLACTGPVEADASGIDTTTFQCCLGVEDALIGGQAPFEVDSGVVTSDPSAVNCCNAIIAHVDQVTTDYNAASQALQLCCPALKYPPGIACTPWGPPTPPAMADVLQEVA